MPIHKMKVVIPENHRLVIEVPESLSSGPAELTLSVPEREPSVGPEAPDPAALARWDHVMAALAKDPRPFDSLTLEEKQERHRLLRGVGRGILPSSDAIARAKRREIEIEEAKFGR